MTGHTSFTTPAPHEIGGVILCRRSTGDEPRMGRVVRVHRAPRAGCLTGLRAGTPVSALFRSATLLSTRFPGSPVASLLPTGQGVK